MLGGNQGKPGSVSVAWFKTDELKYFTVPADCTELSYELEDIKGDFEEATYASTR